MRLFPLFMRLTFTPPLLVLAFSLTLTTTASAQAPVIRNVSQIYLDFCASCHGADGSGGTAPSMLDANWSLGDDDDRVAQIIREGTADGGMPGFGAALDEREIRTLVVHLRELRTNYQRRRTTLPAPAADTTLRTAEHAFRIETIADNLSTPWGIDWLPDGRMLVAEKSGTLRIGTPAAGLDAQPIADIPAVLNQGQGGLMEVAVHPDYASNGWIYLAYSDPLEKDGRTASLTKITRGRLRDHRFVDQETIWQADAEHYLAGNVHWGCRIVFQDGYLFFTHGERGRPQLAQDLTHPAGKTHRIHDDGRIPADNPFLDTPGAIASLWTYGNRNAQGLAIHPVTGDLWETEHGPRGGDELNLLKRGANYGWPAITHGMNYNGTPVTAETARDGMEQPVIHWTPSIAVCGIDFYTGDKFPAWRNNLLVTALAQQHVRRVAIDENNRVTHEEILFEDIGRARDVSAGPDGYIYVALNNPHQIIRLVPAE